MGIHLISTTLQEWLVQEKNPLHRPVTLAGLDSVVINN